ncbi:MAG: LPS assembly protein LptD [Hyphomicrobiaceae bacterium]|nr:LPS assembly protein LptD [Hyphomicrobiaceae bacterium]
MWSATLKEAGAQSTVADTAGIATAGKGAPSSFPKIPGGPLGGPIQTIDKSQPLYLQGDELIYDTRNNRVVARGNVEIYYNNYILTADEVIYDQGANTLIAQGNAQLKEPNGNIVKGDRIETTADFRDAFIQSLSLIGRDDTRIAARKAVRKDGNVTEFEQGKFTPCKNDPGKPPLWCLSAQRVVHDQQAATITYQDAQFELFGVPIIYLPYFQHADPSVKRRSGFLAPEYSTNTNLGFGTSLPYYFAIAPNADFTFDPKVWSKQGILYQGEWRHRVAIGGITGQYNVKLAGIDQDSDNLPDGTDPAKRARLDGWRGSVQTKGVFSLSSWWKFGWDATIESDDTFRRFYKLDNILQTDRINTAWLQGLSDRNYFGMQFYQFGGLLLEDSPASESRVHPVIDWSYIVGQPVLGGELSFNSNAQSISRSDGTDSSRVAFDASWRRKLIDGLGQVWTPFAYARADVTTFTNGFDPDTTTSIGEDTITRAIGAVGIKYAYPFVAHTSAGAHVVEPVGQVVARPAHVSQRRLPDEDAKSLIWDDTLLFDVDKFSGWDRIETGTRANVGLQYTFQAASGGYARFIAGQSFHVAGTNPFADPGRVPYDTVDANGIQSSTTIANFSPNSGLDTDRSDYVIGAYIAPIQNFRLVGQSRFDEQELSLRRQNVYSSLALGPLSLQAQYAYTRDDPQLGIYTSQQEVIGGAGLKLTDNWSVQGLARFDIDERLWLQEQFQIKYSDECFVLTASYIENHINNPTLDIKPDRTVMLRFELKHLGQFSYKTDALDHIFAENQPAR